MEIRITDNQLVGGSIPEGLLYAGLTYLDLEGCELLTQLPENLPAGITNLNLWGCESLTQLPANLPAGLTNLDLSGCELLLQPTPELIAQLNEIEIRHHDSQVIRPDHWRVRDMMVEAPRNVGGDRLGGGGGLTREQADKLDEVRGRLTKALLGVEPRPTDLLDIFGKFTTQNIAYGDRDVDEIIEVSELVALLLEQDPSHSKWMDEIAKYYDQGCVNQPVQCLIEIAGFAGVCQKKEVRDKVEASRQILARRAIIGFFATLPPEDKPGPGVEVEFGNALIREVHRNFLDTKLIAEPWLGIPSMIAYEGMVVDKLHLVGDACAYVQREVMDIKRNEIAKRLLGFLEGGAEGMDPPYRHIALAWIGAMIHGNEKLEAKSQEIDRKYQEEKEFCKSEIEFLEFARSANAGDRLGAEDEAKFRERYRKEFVGTPAEKAKKFEYDMQSALESYNSVDSCKEKDKVDLIKSAVKKRVLPQLPPSASVRGVVRGSVRHVASGRSSPQAAPAPDDPSWRWHR